MFLKSGMRQEYFIHIDQLLQNLQYLFTEVIINQQIFTESVMLWKDEKY